MAFLDYWKKIDVRYETDVFVAGGGPAGAAAAVAAARNGKRVFLAEAQGCFGGAGTSGLVPAFMSFTDGVNFLAGGIGREIHDAVTGDGQIHYGTVPIRHEKLKLIYDRLLAGAGVKFSFFTSLIDVLAENGHIDCVVLSAKSGIFAVKAKVYIDATGDGDLSVWAGADAELGDEQGNCMPPTLCSLWGGIDFTRTQGPDDKNLEQAFKDGIFKYEDRHLPGMFKITESMGGGNIGHCFNVDATDERSLTAAMLRGREYMAEYERYYKEYLTGYENMELYTTGACLGVRESRRVKCDYTLNINDFNKRAVFDDEIGRFSYPVDIHIMAPDKASYDKFINEFRTLRYQKGESYGIPYRCLIPAGLDNGLVCGRCAGTDRQMEASIRVMPGCYITGQAAGTAAALACDKNGDVRAVETRKLQRSLQKLGAYLPNFI
jgi:hypothetical protein